MAILGRSIPIQPHFDRLFALNTSVVFDNAVTSAYEASLSTYNFNITVANQPNRILVVGVSIFAAGTVTGITAGGTAMAFVRSDTNGIYRSELWRLFAPATGVVNVVVTLSASLTSIANAQAYYNTDQTALDANNGGNGTNNPASASITTVLANSTVVGNLAAQTASGVTSAAGQYQRTTSNGALGTGASADFGDVIPAGSKTFTWNGIGAVDSWAISLLSLRTPQTGITAFFRKTLSSIGSRIGSRQTHGWSQ